MANTTNQGWSKPTVGGSEDTWGATINTTLDAIDTLVGPVTAAEIAKLDGLTSSTAELNKLTGVTSTPTELNLVAGLTASTAELNYATGVTSAIQTQINTLTSGKQSVDATLTALSGLATGANKVPYSTGVDTFGQLDLKDEDNMASDSATAVPSQQSVKAYVDASSPITTTSGTAPYYGVRAWGYFASNVKVDGGNFASWDSTTNTVSFTTAMPHANYAVSLDASVVGGAVYSNAHTTAGFEIIQKTTGGNAADPHTVRFMVIC
jgi:hypothetical protein